MDCLHCLYEDCILDKFPATAQELQSIQNGAQNIMPKMKQNQQEYSKLARKLRDASNVERRRTLKKEWCKNNLEKVQAQRYR
ncbi:hypothetical protein, partial [Oscillibacter ruminantium]